MADEETSAGTITLGLRWKRALDDEALTLLGSTVGWVYYTGSEWRVYVQVSWLERIPTGYPTREAAKDALKDAVMAKGVESKEVVQLRAALHPFADRAADWDPSENDGHQFEDGERADQIDGLTIGDFRNARAALAKAREAGIVS